MRESLPEAGRVVIVMGKIDSDRWCLPKEAQSLVDAGNMVFVAPQFMVRDPGMLYKV